ncbi:MAG: glycoside hydrolase family 127 protein [Bacteroidales bacterium]|nr:glycoside hydrolase family 127 protein [Bacteroidales bacterium]
MRRKELLICFKSTLLSLLLSSFSFSCLASEEDKFMPLPSGAIKLNGYFENDIQNSIEHWNKSALPYHKFVEFFRTGRAQFALGEMWGKGVRSGCMFYRYTSDPELKAILKKTVYDLLSTQQSNGSISCVKEDKQPDGVGGDLWERKYVLLGLDEYYENVDKDPLVIESMRKQADCIISQIGESPKVSITELGWSPNHIESTTLLEPFMRLYKLTKEQKYLDFAKYIVEVSGGSKGYNIFQQAHDNVPPHKMGGPYPKAYEMMSLFEGLVEYYRVTGNSYYKDSFINLYNNIKENEITIIGNGGGDQPYHPAVAGEGWDNTALEQTNPNITRMMETCVGVTWMKLCSQILRLTGDPSTVDEIEKYIYNGLIGAMKPSGDGFSYVNLLNGNKVTNEGWGWTFDGFPVTCCNLNGQMGLAYIPYISAMQSKDGPVINLYNGAEIKTLTPKNKELHMTVKSQFPISEKIQLDVNPEEKELFTIKLRIPKWSKNTVVKVNGKRQNAIAGKYLDIKREWKKGDKITLSFDMTCYLIDAPKGSNEKGNNFKALVAGPIVLARDENIDSNYNKPVEIKCDKNRIVKIKRVNPSLKSTRIEYEVPTSDGKIRMSDYSSVNCWDGSHICTWLPIK